MLKLYFIKYFINNNNNFDIYQSIKIIWCHIGIQCHFIINSVWELYNIKKII